jgi:hypothetical protein
MLRGRKIALAASVPLLLLLACLPAGPVYGGTCSNPTGNEDDQIYNGDYHTWQFCNGTSWLAFGGGGSCAPSGGYSPTVPSGHGYFVMSGGTYNGNLGTLSGADATCLTDLTTNTGWKGYSTANSNGQLIAGKVHAFLCDSGTCANLMPVTTYYFANAGNSSAGGASFTTDSSGFGPNDSADWSAANYFSGTYYYWSNRKWNSSSQWNSQSASPDLGNAVYFSCSSWTDQYENGVIGISAITDYNRWGDEGYNSGSGAYCGTSLNLVCFVNP